MNRSGLRRYAILAFVLLMVAAGVLTALSGAHAQAGVYTVTGEITDTDEAPLAGADVFLSPADEDGPTREATTDEDGTYTFDQVENGRYQVVANHACCTPADDTVDVGGTQLEHRVDLELEPDDASSDDAILLRGRTLHHDDETPIPNVRLTFHNHHDATAHHESRGHEETATTVTSKEDGTYVVELRPGHVRLTTQADGYDETTASFPIEENRDLDIPMRPASEQAATLQGTVQSDDGVPIEDARVSVAPDREDRCGPHYCTATPMPHGEEADRRGDVTFRYRPAASPYDDARTDEEGRYRLTTSEGPVRLTAWAHDHARTERTLHVIAGETHEENLTLQRIPPDNVRIEGTVIDQANGDPVPYAHVRLENQQWSHHNATITDENGTFELRTKPGYTILHARAHDRAPIPCDEAPHHPERSASSTQSSPAVPPCKTEEREHAYLPRSITLRGDNATRHDLDIELLRKPAPDARLQGWTINATNEEGIPNATITFTNELTHERGRATTDEDGSFRADVRFGYYTVRVLADGYYHAVENLEIAPNQTRTIAIELVPGQPRHGYVHHVAYAEEVPARDASQPTDGSDEAAAQEAMAAPPIEPVGGILTFEGSPGDLGPYDPARVDQASPSERPTPTVGLAMVMMLTGLLALARRRR